LKLKYDEPLSNFAFNFNLRRYDVVLGPAEAAPLVWLDVTVVKAPTPYIPFLGVELVLKAGGAG
jgi:hypothetical protein